MVAQGKTTKKKFDAVKLMRQLRDQLSQEMEGMTSAERLRYIRDKATSTGLGKALTQDENKLAPPDEAANRISVESKLDADKDEMARIKEMRDRAYTLVDQVIFP